nr:auxin-induced protein 15A-like [Ipomoea batatas]
MAIRVPSVTHSSRILRKFSSRDIPKGHIAVYVGQDDQKKRYVSHPWFQDLLSQAQEEFGFNHSMGVRNYSMEVESSTLETVIAIILRSIHSS